jgi:mutator protein MutT
MSVSNTDLQAGSFRESFCFCPKCGKQESFDYRHNNLLCRICGFSFYVNPPSAVIALLFNEKNELLLSQRKEEPHQDVYDFPGGFVSPGESLEEALKREIREELNLVINDLVYFGSYPSVYPFEGLTYHPVDAAFKCIVEDWSHLITGDDVKSVCFRSVFDILEEDLAFSSNRSIIKQLQMDKGEFVQSL